MTQTQMTKRYDVAEQRLETLRHQIHARPTKAAYAELVAAQKEMREAEQALDFASAPSLVS